MKNWESLIGAKIEAHRDTHKVCKVEDAQKVDGQPPRLLHQGIENQTQGETG